MNIIIPLGGKGERFSKNGFKTPKPLIPILDKTMIEYVLDNIKFLQEDRVYIIYNEALEQYDFTHFLQKKYQNIQFIKIQDTKGAVETLLIGIGQIIMSSLYDKNRKTILLDCDTYYTEDILTIFRNATHNMVFYTKNTDPNPIYSYIELCHIDNHIIDIKEKEKISDNANTGAYAFLDILELYQYCIYILENNITFRGEPYTSCVIAEMIKDKNTFIGFELDVSTVISLGTPQAIQEYIDKTYAYMFDLDGTLVITDTIYYQVWTTILNEFNIGISPEIFKNYIQGNNDTYVLHSLLMNTSITLDELSTKKDQLFLQYIDQVKIVEGSLAFIQYLKKGGHKVCIVTNCNRSIAERIVEQVGIKEYIDFIISCQDCLYGKPNGEPYLNALKKYNISSEKCIVFEDSKTGIISGKSVSPRLLVGLETIYSTDELQKYGCDFSISNYIGLEMLDLLNRDNDNIINQLSIWIRDSITQYDIQEIIFDNNKLKGGFIADVISFKLITKDHDEKHFIFKYENKNENGLSLMAKQLELYNREYYFYTNISPVIPVKIPEFIQVVKNEKSETVGIILENLFKKGYQINLNLNIESIDVSLKIVDQMAKMHAHFWGSDLKIQFPELKTTTDPIFSPFIPNFIKERNTAFKNRWKSTITDQQMILYDKAVESFVDIQRRFSQGSHLTIIHGDIKSPNIFYDSEKNPYFIDWQHCGIGKGVQDLIFFIIESFDISQIKIIYPILKDYYFQKILEYGITKYNLDEYENDLYDAVCYIPLFTSVWFGTIPQEELIDKDFPFLFMNKMFYLMEIILC